MTEPTNAKADIVPFTEEYAELIRSWIDSEETLHNVCRGKEFPPADDIVMSWQRSDVSAYILFSERRPIAYGELWARPNERAVEIAHLLVDPYKRLQGFGVKMLELLYDRGAERPFIIKVIINLYTESEAALGCYLKAKFELVGTATHTVGLRMVRLVRR